MFHLLFFKRNGTRGKWCSGSSNEDSGEIWTLEDYSLTSHEATEAPFAGGITSSGAKITIEDRGNGEEDDGEDYDGGGVYGDGGDRIYESEEYYSEESMENSQKIHCGEEGFEPGEFFCLHSSLQ